MKTVAVKHLVAAPESNGSGKDGQTLVVQHLEIKPEAKDEEKDTQTAPVDKTSHGKNFKRDGSLTIEQL